MFCNECSSEVNDLYYAFVDDDDNEHWYCVDCIETTAKRRGVTANICSDWRTYTVLLNEDGTVNDVLSDNVQVYRQLLKAGVLTENDVETYYNDLKENERLARHGL